MADISQTSNSSQSLQSAECRRRAPRIPMPIAVQLECAGQTCEAIVRDLAFSSFQQPNGCCSSNVSGIAILHHESLPLETAIICRTRVESADLPAVTELILKWSRHFSNEAFLSGGELRLTK